jgi:hypothetical protein
MLGVYQISWEHRVGTLTRAGGISGRGITINKNTEGETLKWFEFLKRPVDPGHGEIKEVIRGKSTGSTVYKADKFWLYPEESKELLKSDQ